MDVDGSVGGVRNYEMKSEDSGCETMSVGLRQSDMEMNDASTDTKVSTILKRYIHC